MSKEGLEVDVIIVGGGPAGLSMAIALKRLDPNQDIMILEKGRSVGNHILSGAVMDPSALDELLPNWRSQYQDYTPVDHASMYYLTKRSAIRLPHLPNAGQEGGCILSLSQLTRFLADQARALGVEILTGYVANEPIYVDGQVRGVRTGPMGLDQDGAQTSNYQPPVEIYAKHTVIAEGAKGLLAKAIIDEYQLRSQPQTYGLGVKEVWEVDADVFEPGQVVHALGWPLPADAYGGGFIYQGLDRKVMVGMIVGLDAKNPTLSPFDMLQRFKHHPKWSNLFANGKPIAYGARVINEGGYQAIPTLDFPGGVLIGCAAGFVNIARIKGIHAAIYSGMEAAKAYVRSQSFDANFRSHPVVLDLKRCRNVRPWFYRGRFFGIIGTGIDQYLFRGNCPYTLSIKDDVESIALNGTKVIKPHEPDGKISFDLLTLVQYTNVSHRESEPPHISYQGTQGTIYTYFCPAGVYELSGDQFIINATNCIHCKACTIRNPDQQIQWQHPEGGGGPNYTDT